MKAYVTQPLGDVALLPEGIKMYLAFPVGSKKEKQAKAESFLY